MDPKDGKRGKREVAESLGTRLDNRKDLYAHMQFRPLTGFEERVSAAVDLHHARGQVCEALPSSIRSANSPSSSLAVHMAAQVYAKAVDDGKVTGRRHMDIPGSEAFGKGADMLAWRPEHAVGQFVPYAKLAQEGRSTKPGVPGGTMGRPMPIPRTLSLSSTTRF